MKRATVATAVVFAGLAGMTAATCNDGCARAVFGTARESPGLAERHSLCSAFVSTTTTVTPPTVTVTQPVIYNRNIHAARAFPPVVTGEVPAYASACPDVTAYWTACQCFTGIVATTVTITAPTPTEIVPGPTCTQGIEYAIYGIDENTPRWQNLVQAITAGHDTVDFNLQFSGITPDVTGVTPTFGSIIQFVDNPDLPVSIYGQVGRPGSIMGRSVIDHRGYLVPATAGAYTISLETSDNAFHAWVGEFAISGWSPTNPSVSRFWPPDQASPNTYTITIGASDINTPIPFRFLWMNYGGPGAFSGRIVDPQGTVILGLESQKNPQILSSCSGPRALVPAWAPWAEEK